VGWALGLVVFVGVAAVVLAALLSLIQAQWRPASIHIMQFLLAHWGHALVPLIIGIGAGVKNGEAGFWAVLSYATPMHSAGFDKVLFEGYVDPDPTHKMILTIAGWVGLGIIGFIIYIIPRSLFGER
jgi:hypothetical protein